MKKKIMAAGIVILSMSSSLFSLDFNALKDRIDNSFEVREALISAEQLQREANLYSHNGDVTFSLNPSVKAVTTEGEKFAEELQVYGTASVRIPIGLSASEREKFDFSLNSLKLAESLVESAREKTFIRYYSLYQKMWLLQEEEQIIKMEVNISEIFRDSQKQKFELGNISLIEYNDADERLQEQYENYSNNQLEQKITWFEIRSIADLNSDLEKFEKATLLIEEPPKPFELYSWLVENQRQIIAARTKLEQISATLERLKQPDFDISIKSFYNSSKYDISANISYDFNNYDLTPSVDFPIYTFGEIPSGGSGAAETWNLGMTFSLSLGTNKSDSLNGEILKSELARSGAELEYLIETLSLELRSDYQQHLRDLDALDLSVRNLTAINENYKIINMKKEMGQVSELEILEADALVQRSEWKVESARIEAEKSWLNLLESAVWFKNTDLDL